MIVTSVLHLPTFAHEKSILYYVGRALHGLYQPTSAVIEGKPLLSLVDIFVQLIYFKGCPVHILTEEIETGPAASVYCRFLRVQRRHSSLAAQKKTIRRE